MFRSISQFSAVVWLVIIATMATRFTFFMVWPYLALILHQLHGLNALEIGAFLGVSGIIGNFLGLYVGYLSDRFGRRQAIVSGFVLSITALITLGLSESLVLILVAIVAQGVSRNAIESSGKALLTDELEDRSAKDLALHARYYALNIGASFGPLVGIAFGLTGKQTTFLLVAATMGIYLIAALLIFFRAPPKKAPNKSSGFTFRSVLKTLADDRRFMVFVVAMFFGLIAYSQLEIGIVQYLRVAMHPDVIAFYPIITLTNGMTVLVLQFPLLALTERFRPAMRSMVGIGFMSIAFAMIAIIPVSNEAMFLFAIIVLSVGEVILFPTLQIMIDRMAPEDMKGSYFGAAALAGFGFAAGPIVGGLLLEHAGGAALWWSMVGVTLLVAAMYRLADWLGQRT
ncbi:MAG: MFS transporter [Paracoccaceae bacterium]|nr:MFS transporter [Paracoccaceae bacterium]